MRVGGREGKGGKGRRETILRDEGTHSLSSLCLIIRAAAMGSPPPGKVWRRLLDFSWTTDLFGGLYSCRGLLGGLSS